MFLNDFLTSLNNTIMNCFFALEVQTSGLLNVLLGTLQTAEYQVLDVVIFASVDDMLTLRNKTHIVETKRAIGVMLSRHVIYARIVCG